MKHLYLFVIIICISIPLRSQNSIVKGIVVDDLNNDPLPFVNVIVSGTTIGSVTDSDGVYEIFGLDPGFIQLEASFVGYNKVVTSEIEISNANSTYIEIRLSSTDTELEEVYVVVDNYREKRESPLALRNISTREIESNPGANRDISKVIQSFPGVSFTPAFRNDVIIRGGGPSENVFYLDGVEVPNINHFATQGASGGPVGIINADFVREVNYYSGAFPASRFDALSGVFEFNQIEGNNDRFKLKTTLGASEIAATVDGPIGDKTNYIFSVRRSYLQFLFSILDLPFLPTFNDMQFKIKNKIDYRNEITFIGLGAIDKFDLNTDIDNPDSEQEYILASTPENDQWSYTVGAVYKHYKDNGYYSFTVSRSHLNNSSDKYIDNDDSSQENLVLDYVSNEIENKVRFDYVFNIKSLKTALGVNMDVVEFDVNSFQEILIDSSVIEQRYLTDLTFLKFGMFIQLTDSYLKNRLTASLGLRVDANTYSSNMGYASDHFSPRFSLRYRVLSNVYLNSSVGKYFQLPALTTLGYRENGELVNRENEIEYISSTHYNFGIEYRPSDQSKISLEGFYKGYSDYPFSLNDSICLANKGGDYGVVGDEEVKSVSNGRAYGFELFGRYDNRKNITGNIAYTFVRSEFDRAGDENYIPSSWDSRHLLTSNVIFRFESNWSFGAKWRLSGGLPYTDYDLETSANVEAWNANGGPYLNYSKFNEKRFSSFHQLDVRVDKVYYFENWTAKFYIDIQNLYNFKSEEQDIVIREKDDLGNYLTANNGEKYVLKSIESETGTVLPTIGIILEF